ncbi:hypothetical protein KGF54_003004 [Candida jiufengensis]|uniref:uncharacterized protein n=1 Tax=Candida jiufengensis TaxID=497108 RepID=UPI00222520F4|nr:uncharacterized protein KGF54_003004 [Candida jiufengensis]KAI5953632.1 hypothetical protein KGF54_003004 [Candida jiufengensis]
MVIKPQHIRKPEFNERSYICRNDGKFYSNFNNSAKYSKNVTTSHLSIALRSLILKNSWFCHNFLKTSHTNSKLHNYHNWVVRYVKEIKFNDVVEYKKIDVFDENCLEYMDSFVIKMNVEKPLWKIIVWEENNGEQLISVLFDHSQFDGLSGAQFQKDLTKELSLVKDDKNVIDILFDYEKDFEYLPPEIWPATEVLTDLYVPTYTNMINHYLTKFVPGYSSLSSWLYKRDPPLYAKPTSLDRTLKSKYKLLKINSDQMTKISNFCKSNGITVTAYLDVLFLESLQETIFKSLYPNKKFSTNSYVAINGRRYYNDDIKNFRYGSMVCGNDLYLPPIKDPLQSMKDFNYQLNQDIKNKTYFKVIGMIQFRQLWDFLNGRIGKIGVTPTLTISNLGIVSDSNDEYKFKEMYFGANAGLTFDFVIDVTTLSNNEMTIVLAHMPEYELMLHGRSAIDRLYKLYLHKLLDVDTN